MSGAARVFSLRNLLSPLLPVLGLFGCSSSQPPAPPAQPVFQNPITSAPSPVVPAGPQTIMLGIDVLESEGYGAIKGKRIGLLTHPAGVNRHGTSTIDVLRKAPGVKLVALFAAEHGLYGDAPAAVNIANTVDKR